MGSGHSRTLLRENLTQPLHSANFQSIFARSTSAIITPSKKVQLTLIGSPVRAY